MCENSDYAFALYENGELDYLRSNDIPLSEITELREESDEFKAGLRLGTSYIGFNTTKNPLDNPLVRKALGSTMDREAIADKLGGRIKASNSWIPEGMLALELILDTWEKHLGVEVELLSVMTRQEYLNLRDNPEENPYATIYSSGWIADYPDPHNFMDLFRCTSGNNSIGWCNGAMKNMTI